MYGEVTEQDKSFPDLARQAQLRCLPREVSPYVPTFAILERCGGLRRRLRPPHGPGLIGDIDTQIAATTLAHGLTQVTMDSDYQRVPDLELTLLPRKA